MVVWGHSNMPEIIAKWIYSFHMPLFFFISGFLARNNSFYPTIKRKLKTLLIPYVVFSVISIFMLKILDVKYFDNEIMELYSGWRTYALWFLTTLFITEISFSLLKPYLRSKRFLMVLAITFFLIGYLLALKNIFLWYKIEIVFNTLSWFIIGHLTNRVGTFKLDNKLKLYTIICLFALSILLSIMLPRFDMSLNSLGLFPLNHMNAIIGISLVVILSMKLTEYKLATKILTYLGSNTMIILCTHQILIFTIKRGTQLFWVPSLADSIFRQILFWCLIPMVIFIINKKFYFLLGK